MRKFLVVLALLGLMALPLMAEDKAEVYGAYQYLRLNDVGGCGNNNGCPNVNANGWDTGASVFFNHYLGVTGDFSGTYHTQSVDTGSGSSLNVPLHFYTFAGGPVVAFNRGKINPYVHALFGGVHVGASASDDGVTVSTSKTGFVTMVGGGVDVRAAKVISVRLINVDWVYYHFSGIFDGPSYGNSDNVRINAGVVFRF